MDVPARAGRGGGLATFEAINWEGEAPAEPQVFCHDRLAKEPHPPKTDFSHTFRGLPARFGGVPLKYGG